MGETLDNLIIELLNFSNGGEVNGRDPHWRN